MSPLICLFALIAVAFGAPALTDRQQKLVKIFGEDTNITRAEGIIAEEAKKLGVSTDEYYAACTADADIADFTEQEAADLKREVEALANEDIKVNNKDEVLKVLKQKAPKTYEAILKRIAVVDKYMPKLDAEGQKFVRKIGDFVLEGVVTISKVNDDFFGQLDTMGKLIGQLYSDYNALPQASKDLLEKTFCINGALRIAENGKLEKLIGLVKSIQNL